MPLNPLPFPPPTPRDPIAEAMMAKHNPGCGYLVTGECYCYLPEYMPGGTLCPCVQCENARLDGRIGLDENSHAYNGEG